MDDGKHGAMNNGRNLFEDFSGAWGVWEGGTCTAGSPALVRRGTAHGAACTKPVCTRIPPSHPVRCLPFTRAPAEVAESTGVYTAESYCGIMEHLIQRWDIANLRDLNAKGAEAQEFVCTLPTRIRRLAERKAVRKAKTAKEPVRFSWLYDRPLDLHFNEMATARTRGTARA